MTDSFPFKITSITVVLMTEVNNFGSMFMAAGYSLFITTSRLNYGAALSSTSWMHGALPLGVNCLQAAAHLSSTFKIKFGALLHLPLYTFMAQCLATWTNLCFFIMAGMT
jgi:hypothetical protein